MNKTAFFFSKAISFITRINYRHLHQCRNLKTNLKLTNNAPVFNTLSYSFSNQEHIIVSYEELSDITRNKQKDILLIDVRQPEELVETGILPSSINIPLGDLEIALKELSDDEFFKLYGTKKPTKNNHIIFSCKMGKRSFTACEISRQLGFKNVKNYIGGWLEWEERNLSKFNSQVSSSSNVTNSEQYRQVSYDEVKKLKDDPKYILIDVREPSELTEDGSIPGSINIPLNDLENVLTQMPSSEFKLKYGREKPNKESNVIFSCRSGKRSQLAQEKAIALGFRNAISYSGSWLDWEEHSKKSI